MCSMSNGSLIECPLQRYSSLQPYHDIFFYLLISILCDKMKRVDASVVYLIEGRRPSAVSTRKFSRFERSAYRHCSINDKRSWLWCIS